MNSPKITSLMLILAAGVLLFASQGQAAETISYSYDGAGRLISAVGNAGRAYRYSYDAAGNLAVFAAVINADSDADGMDDAWEMENFGSLSRNGTADFDNDGASDLAEFLAGSNPTDPNSKLSVTSFSTAVSTATIRWQSIPGKTYRVQYKDSLSTASWSDLPGDVLAGEPVSVKTDPAATGITRFYRVVVVR